MASGSPVPIGTAHDPAMEEHCSSWAQRVNTHRERIAFLQGTPLHTSPDCPPRGPYTGHTGGPCSPATRFVPFSLDGPPEGPAPTGCSTTLPTRSSQPAVAPPLSAQRLSSDALAPTGCPGEPPASSSDLQHKLLLAMDLLVFQHKQLRAQDILSRMLSQQAEHFRRHLSVSQTRLDAAHNNLNHALNALAWPELGALPTSSCLCQLRGACFASEPAQAHARKPVQAPRQVSTLTPPANRWPARITVAARSGPLKPAQQEPLGGLHPPAHSKKLHMLLPAGHPMPVPDPKAAPARLSSNRPTPLLPGAHGPDAERPPTPAPFCTPSRHRLRAIASYAASSLEAYCAQLMQFLQAHQPNLAHLSVA